MINIPALISASCITLYWLTVIVKAIKISKQIGKDPNVLPRERNGRLIRLIWAPTILFWILLLWKGILTTPKPLAYLAAGVVLTGTALTFYCWKKMGTSWRIGIDPREKTQLIVTGPYQYVLHPIYSLSIILGITTFLTLPTPPMLIIVVLHILMLNLEARREEKYLIKTHGTSYLKYQENRGRFIPRLL